MKLILKYVDVLVKLVKSILRFVRTRLKQISIWRNALRRRRPSKGHASSNKLKSSPEGLWKLDVYTGCSIGKNQTEISVAIHTSIVVKPKYV